jgi:two-component system, sensor histidine kinase
LFGSILIATAAASATSVLIAVGLISLGFVALGTGLAWIIYLYAFGVCNLALRGFYLRSRPVGDRWRAWAIAFTAINFAVGVGFGWAPVGLTTGSAEAEPHRVSRHALHGRGRNSSVRPLSSSVPVLPSADDHSLRCGELLLGRSASAPARADIDIGIRCRNGRSRNEGEPIVRAIGRLKNPDEELALDLQRQKDIAEQANRAKSMFLAAASHDLRQPVHALGLFVGALRGVAMAPEGERMLAQIEASITAMNGLFSALLDISRLEAGVVTVERRPFAIQQVMDRVSRDFVREAETKGVSLVWKACAAWSAAGGD